jgi:hypothetical protein
VPSEGIAVSGSSTWANAGPAHNKDQAVATISNGLIKDSPIRAEDRSNQRQSRCHSPFTDRAAASNAESLRCSGQVHGQKVAGSRESFN